jgi:hypothetical protein
VLGLQRRSSADDFPLFHGTLAAGE